jgi:hypothetical protein
MLPVEVCFCATDCVPAQVEEDLTLMMKPEVVPVLMEMKGGVGAQVKVEAGAAMAVVVVVGAEVLAVVAMEEEDAAVVMLAVDVQQEVEAQISVAVVGEVEGV